MDSSASAPRLEPRSAGAGKAADGVDSVNSVDLVVSHPLAYVFERFPSFTQTFCAREVVELERQGLAPLIFSIHDTSAEPPGQFDPALRARTITLPPREELAAQIQEWKEAGRLSQDAVLLLRHWGARADKNRLLEAIWIGKELRQRGICHVHTHFAGVGARTCWWLRQLEGVSYSVTGHANDLFCADEEVLSLDRVLGDAALVVTVSDFTADWIRGRVPRARVERVYNGLDLAPFQEQAAQPEQQTQAPQIIGVGRLIEKKGFADLIRACGALQRRGVGFRCVIVGDGPLQGELEALRDAQGLTESEVRFAGAQPMDRVRELLAQSQIFALPCVVEADGGMDNLPTVIAEAMAARLPVVSTRLAGVPEMVTDGETGLLVEPGDVPGLAAALAELLADPARRQRFGAAGQVRSAALFDRVGTVAQLRRLLVGRGRIHPRLGAPVWPADLWWPWLCQQARRLGWRGGFGPRWRWRTPKNQSEAGFFTSALGSLGRKG